MTASFQHVAHRVALPRRHVLIPLCGLALMSLIAQFTDLNLLIARYFYLQTRHRWLGAGHWWADTLIHDWGRNLIALIFLLALCVVVLSFLLPHSLRRWRKAAGYLALCIAMSTALVGLGKKYSNVDCPWDAPQFGGRIPYVHLFSPKPADLPTGRCFPGGHSSGAFSLFGLYFLFLLYRPQYARRVLAGVILLGTVYAFGQWARGAHFVIDDIWSAVIAWYIALGLFMVFFNRTQTQT